MFLHCPWRDPSPVSSEIFKFKSISIGGDSLGISTESHFHIGDLNRSPCRGGNKTRFRGRCHRRILGAHAQLSRFSPRKPFSCSNKTRVSLSASRRNGLCVLLLFSSPFVYCAGSLGCIHTIGPSLVQGRTPHITHRALQTSLNSSLKRRRIKSFLLFPASNFPRRKTSKRRERVQRVLPNY